MNTFDADSLQLWESPASLNGINSKKWKSVDVIKSHDVRWQQFAFIFVCTFSTVINALFNVLTLKQFKVQNKKSAKIYLQIEMQKCFN